MPNIAPARALEPVWLPETYGSGIINRRFETPPQFPSVATAALRPGRQGTTKELTKRGFFSHNHLQRLPNRLESTALCPIGRIVGREDFNADLRRNDKRIWIRRLGVAVRMKPTSIGAHGICLGGK
jgi:hypothetical protein